MLAKYMDESRVDPDGDLVPHDTVAAMDTRRKQLKEAGQKVSFTHLIAYAIARAGTESDARDSPPLRGSATAGRRPIDDGGGEPRASRSTSRSSDGSRR